MTKQTCLLFLTCCLLSLRGWAQDEEIFKLDKIYLDQKDSTQNCYSVFVPSQSPYTGYIILLPGFGETAERVVVQTLLPYDLARSGLLTIVPTLQGGVMSFGVDSLSQQSLDRIIKDVQSRYRLSDLPFYLGGYSIGGSAAIKYAENAQVKPNAVFAIDSPLDFERMYNAAQRDIRLSTDSLANPENTYIVNRLEKELGGSPQTLQRAYYNYSPYSFSDTAQTAVKKLVAIPIRLYTEPDIEWWMKERRADFTAMNATENSAMINELNRLGNNRAELIVTQNRGYRKPDNTRHPHSWSIVNNTDIIAWLLKQR